MGCSSNDLIDNDPDAAPTKGVSFTLTEPDFGEEVVMGGRKINSMPNPTDTTDLGDGVLGEVLQEIEALFAFLLCQDLPRI